MILTRHELTEYIHEKKISFSPSLDIFQNQPHAIDLRLGQTFYIQKKWKVTSRGREILCVDAMQQREENHEIINLNPGQYFEIAPGESIIASTLESIKLDTPDVMGVLYPRSSINRRGISVDLTGIIDAYYQGHLMIPMLNKTQNQIIRIYPGERICQVLFHRLSQSLTEEESLRHGKNAAKYNAANAHSLTDKQDDEQEIAYIKSGDLEGLKSHKY